MNKEVPMEVMGSKGPFIEGKFIIDKPLRIKSCLRCWKPLRFKENKLYCDTCKKFRTAKTSHWIDQISDIQFVTEEQMTELLKE